MPLKIIDRIRNKKNHIMLVLCMASPNWLISFTCWYFLFTVMTFTLYAEFINMLQCTILVWKIEKPSANDISIFHHKIVGLSACKYSNADTNLWLNLCEALFSNSNDIMSLIGLNRQLLKLMVLKNYECKASSVIFTCVGPSALP